MNISRPNLTNLVFLLLLSQLLLIVTLSTGTTKGWAQIDWLDIAGEGSAAIIAILWLLFIAASRPAGSVTTYLMTGLGLVFLAFWQDWIDEFVSLPAEAYALKMLESSLMIAGLVFLNIGLWQWHLEQRVVNQQLQRREQTFRQHTRIDGLTQLADAEYLQQQIDYQLAQLDHESTALLMIDIDNFSLINQRYGSREGDRLLQEMGEILLLNLRKKDLLCRYAGDRFSVLMPDAGFDIAETMAMQLRNCIAHFTFKAGQSNDTSYQTISIGIAVTEDRNHTSLIDEANQALLIEKQKGEWTSAA